MWYCSQEQTEWDSLKLEQLEKQKLIWEAKQMYWTAGVLQQPRTQNTPTTVYGETYRNSANALESPQNYTILYVRDLLWKLS